MPRCQNVEKNKLALARSFEYEKEQKKKK